MTHPGTLAAELTLMDAREGAIDLPVQRSPQAGDDGGDETQRVEIQDHPSVTLRHP